MYYAPYSPAQAQQDPETGDPDFGGWGQWHGPTPWGTPPPWPGPDVQPAGDADEAFLAWLRGLHGWYQQLLVVLAMPEDSQDARFLKSEALKDMQQQYRDLSNARPSLLDLSDPMRAWWESSYGEAWTARIYLGIFGQHQSIDSRIEQATQTGGRLPGDRPAPVPSPTPTGPSPRPAAPTPAPAPTQPAPTPSDPPYVPIPRYGPYTDEELAELERRRLAARGR